MVCAAVALSTSLLLDRLDLVLGLVVEVLEELRAVGGQLARSVEAGVAAALQQARFLDAPLQPLAAAAQRFVDRGRRGGEAALQDLQREADVLRAADRPRRAGRRGSSPRGRSR